MSTATIINGDARRLPLADGSVHCVVTSPPYFGLRSYGVGVENGEIGLEATPSDFVACMVRVFREVRRVLRDDGTAWVNLGDSYSGSTIGGGDGSKSGLVGTHHAERTGMKAVSDRLTPGLGPKQLLMMPHRVALALQADGWIVRSDIVWAKPNPMPESVTDRPTKSHEYVFLLSKRERYFYDADAVREKAEYGRRVWKDEHFKNGDIRIHHKGTTTGGDPGSGRNLRSVWTIPTHAWPGSHFATFPPALVSRCVKAGTSEKGCCPKCGAGWERETEVDRWSERERRRGTARGWQGLPGRDTEGGQNGCHNMNGQTSGRTVQTLGWRPSCSCPDHAPIPCTVLDIFAGSGTTGVVATGLNRRFVGVDLSPDYCRMAVRRISRPHASHRTARPAEALPLFAGFE